MQFRHLNESTHIKCVDRAWHIGNAVKALLFQYCFSVLFSSIVFPHNEYSHLYNVGI